MASGGEEGDIRIAEIRMVQVSCKDVPFAVVHTDEGDAQRKSHGLGRGNADKERADEAGGMGDGDEVDVRDLHRRLLQRGADHGHEVPEVLPGGELGHHAAVLLVKLHLRRDNVRQDGGIPQHRCRGLITGRLYAEGEHDDVRTGGFCRGSGVPCPVTHAPVSYFTSADTGTISMPCSSIVVSQVRRAVMVAGWGWPMPMALPFC